MNAIDHALSQLTYTIDARLLATGFPIENQWDISTVQQRIRSKIIDGRVLPDLNVAGGQMATVSVAKCAQTYHTDGTLILTVPAEELKNCEILRPMELMFQTPQTTALQGVQSLTTMEQGFARLLNGYTAHQVGDTNLIKLGPNAIWCREIVAVSNTGVLNLMVSNDPELRNITPVMYDKFAKMVGHAVKSYLYAQRFNMQSANVFGGFDQSQYENMVSEYSGSEEEYQLIKERPWKIGTMLTDAKRRRAHIRSITPS